MINRNDFDVLVIRDYYPSVNNPTSSTWVYNQVIGLQEMGFRPLVISPTPINPLKTVFRKKFRLYDSPSVHYENYLDTTVIRPPYLKIPQNKLKGFTLRNLANTILKYGDLPNIKLIHAHFGQNGVAALPIKRKLGVPLVTSFYGYDSGRLGPLFKKYYEGLANEGDLFLVLSNDMKTDLLKLGFPEEKILVHYLGVDVSNFTDNNSIPLPPFVLLTVARLCETKGIQYVLKALDLFFKEHPREKNKFKYKIIGGGEYEHALMKLTEELDLGENVVFINNLIVQNGRDVVISEMKNCDLFVLASSTPPSGGKEGTPVVLMEVQACGKPCISTFHAGIPEVLLNEKTGILVNQHSHKELANAISNLYFDNAKRILFGKNAKEHIHLNYNNKIQLAGLVQIYNGLFK